MKTIWTPSLIRKNPTRVILANVDLCQLEYWNQDRTGHWAICAKNRIHAFQAQLSPFSDDQIKATPAKD